MARVIWAAFRPFRRTPAAQYIDSVQHILSPFMTTTVAANSGRLSFIALSADRRNLHTRPRGLRRRDTLPDLDPQVGKSSDSEDGDARKSRNEKKREAQRAVRWGMDLASFSKSQIKTIVRAASLEEKVIDALMLVKRLGPDVREGKRRQFNYIGKLLREAKPDLLNALIQATKEGDQSTIQALAGAQLDDTDEEEQISESEAEAEEEDEEEEEDDSQNHVALASKWFDGLVNKDIEISNEVYSISGVEFDRQELRRLVRKVQSIEERRGSVEEDEEKLNVELSAAEKSLTRLLRWLAKQTPDEQYDVV